MALSNAAAGFIGASVTLVLVIIFMILMVILVRQCLAFIAKRNAIRNQIEHQRQVREQMRQRRGSVSEPIPATFDWHHAIRIEGTPPPSYVEAKELPAIPGEESQGKKGLGEKGQEDEQEYEGGDKVTEIKTDLKKTVVEENDQITPNNAIHVSSSPDSSSHEITVIQTEVRNGSVPGQRLSPEEALTVTNGYTEYDSA